MLPGVGGVDPRETADPGLPPWSAVLRLQVAGVSRCTAVMVAPNLVATAAHCLFNKALGRAVPVGSVHLLFGYDAGQYARHVIPDAVWYAEGGGGLVTSPRASDIAVLRVPGVGGYSVPPVVGLVAPGTPLLLGGYGQDRAQRLAVDAGCRALGYVAGPDGQALLRHDCSGTRGTSGGPVLVRDGAGWALAGVQVGAERDGAGGVAVPGAAVGRLVDEAR